MNYDLIYGIHSIIEALKNPKRSDFTLFGADESIKKIRQDIRIDEDLVQVIRKKPEQIQALAQKLCKEFDYSYSRAPGNVFLKCTATEILGPEVIFTKLSSEESVKIVCLDSVTDIHNAGAIIRSSAFYGVNYIVFSAKGNFGRGPSFNRISSGALEHVELVRCASLTKFITKLNDHNVYTVGLSEHATDELSTQKGSVCIVLGSEETGISNAVKRVVPNWMSLKPCGKIKSLNVSVASAVVMDRFFS